MFGNVQLCSALTRERKTNPSCGSCRVDSSLGATMRGTHASEGIIMANGPILIISGTNRPNSNALKIARIVEAHYGAAGAPVEIFSLEHLPPEIFHGAAYAHKPPA